MRGGEYPVIPPIHWNGVALPWQRALRTLKTLSNCKGFYNVFSAVERFLYLRDFFYNFDLIDFLIYLREVSKIKFSEISKSIYVLEISEIKYSDISFKRFEKFTQCVRCHV